MNLADAFSKIITPDRRVSFRAYDGSSVGPQDNDVILEIRSPRAVQFLAGAPSQLGLARAYVSGDLEIIGDAYTCGLNHCLSWNAISFANIAIIYHYLFAG